MFEISGTTRLTGLLGSPVAHSISPKMHNEAFRLLGLDYVYLCFDVDEAGLETAVRGLVRCGIRGFNLTMPNKNRIVSMLDGLSPEAELIGAVNTVVVDDDGHTKGYNTDGIGFVRAAKKAGHDMTGMAITVMGAGGAASAICAQAALDGVKEIHQFVRRTSRHLQRAAALSMKINETLSCRHRIIDAEDTEMTRTCLAESDMLINATNVGMAPHTEESILSDHSLLRPGLVVADVIYNPRETLLLKKAREAGCPAFNGLNMLLYQGAEAFRLWTGQEMPAEAMRCVYG